MNNDLPLIVGVTGASGSVYSFEILRFLLSNEYKVHLIFSTNSFQVINTELNLNLSENVANIKERILSFLNIESGENNLKVHLNTDLSASISSGSYFTQGMIILPCSMNTLAAIRMGLANSLITRAADVCIKQGRKLLIAPREMPFSSIHLDNMYTLSLKGVKIAVPSPAFYNNPDNVSDMINFVVGKILDTFEIPNELYKRWK